MVPEHTLGRRNRNAQINWTMRLQSLHFAARAEVERLLFFGTGDPIFRVKERTFPSIAGTFPREQASLQSGE